MIRTIYFLFSIACIVSALPTSTKNDKLTKEQICNLPPLSDMTIQCKVAFDHLHYTFNSTTKECQTFNYGGCGRTENLFDNEDDCKAACGTLPTPEKKVELTKEQLCSLLPLRDMSIQCKVAFHHPHYTFNSTVNKCVEFDYGGCGKTENLFNNEDACKAACSP